MTNDNTLLPRRAHESAFRSSVDLRESSLLAVYTFLTPPRTALGAAGDLVLQTGVGQIVRLASAAGVSVLGLLPVIGVLAFVKKLARGGGDQTPVAVFWLAFGSRSRLGAASAILLITGRWEAVGKAAGGSDSANGAGYPVVTIALAIIILRERLNSVAQRGGACLSLRAMFFSMWEAIPHGSPLAGTPGA